MSSDRPDLHTGKHDQWDQGGYCNNLVLDDDGCGTICGFRDTGTTVSKSGTIAASIDLRVDPERVDGWDDRTGFYVRAVTDDGRWDSVDMAVLDKESFTEFVTSRGDVSDWALSIFYGLFGYPRDTDPLGC